MKRLVAVAAAAASLSGCGSAPAASPSAEAAPSVIASWVQGPDRSLEAMQVAVPQRGVVLLASEEDRTRFLSTASALDSSKLRAVDLSGNIVVLGAYGNCKAASHLDIDDGGATVRFQVTRDEKVNCVWAPYTIDAWQVPRSLLTSDLSRVSFQR